MLNKGACVGIPRQVPDDTDELSASHVELDHQHHLSDLLLLWRARQLHQLGDGRCHQRGCRASYRHSDPVCPSESIKHCIFDDREWCADFLDVLTRKQSTSCFQVTVHRTMLLHPRKSRVQTPASPPLPRRNPLAPGVLRLHLLKIWSRRVRQKTKTSIHKPLFPLEPLRES
jgi:hypothetical protein